MLLSSVGCGYVEKFLWKLPLQMSGNYFFIRIRDITMENWLVSDNYWDNLLLIASIILLKMATALHKNISLLNEVGVG